MKVKEKNEKAGLKLNIQKTKIMASSSITSWQIDEKTIETVSDFIFFGLQNHCRWWLQPWNSKTLTPWKKSFDKPTQYIKKHWHYFAIKSPYSQSYGFSSGHVWMWELDHKESSTLKNWYFWAEALEKTLESPLDCKEIQLVHPKGSQSWIFIGRTDAEAETPILWPPEVQSWLIRKDPDAGKEWRQEENRMTEYKMVDWHHWLNGHEFEQASGDGEEQGGLVCCGPRGHKELLSHDCEDSNMVSKIFNYWWAFWWY